MLKKIYFILFLLLVKINFLYANLLFDDIFNVYGSGNYTKEDHLFQERRIDNRFITTYTNEKLGLKVESHILSSYSRNKKQTYPIPVKLIIKSDKNNLFRLSREDNIIRNDSLTNKIDRLYVSYSHNNYEFVLGRNNLNWGRGKVFSVADFFNSSSPSFYNGDYKIGTDLAYFVYSIDSNSNISFVFNPKRDYQNGNFSLYDSTFAVRYIKSNSYSDYNITAAQYLRDYVFSFGFTTDFVLNTIFKVETSLWSPEYDRGEIISAGLVGLEKEDYYFDYYTTLYVEFYHNGFGKKSLNADLNSSLERRKEYQEANIFGINYLSIGASVEVINSVYLNYSNIISLQDYSLFNLISLKYSYSKQLDVGVSYIQSLGTKNKEFGGNCLDKICVGMISSIMLSATYSIK